MPDADRIKGSANQVKGAVRKSQARRSVTQNLRLKERPTR